MLNHWIRSLSARLWVTTVVVLAASLTALASLVIYVFDHYPEQTLGRREQTENVDRVIGGIRFSDAGIPRSVDLSEREAWLYQIVPTELKYRVLDGQGHVLLASTGAEKDGPWLTGDLSGEVSKIAHVNVDGRRFSIATRRVLRGQSEFYVQTATSARFIEVLVSSKVKPIPATVRVVFFVAVVIFGWALLFTIRRMLKPLRDASDAAAQITPRHLKTRLSTLGVPSEIKPLINAFNEALERLENGFLVQQQFLAAAAHEFQTPLTLIRGQIELQPEIRERDLLFREIDLMSRQVRQLLHLAEASEAQNFDFGEVDIVDVAQDVVAYLARKADGKQVTLRVDERGAAPSIWADKSALFILLKNIVENAINASPAHGIVLLTVDGISIEICDEGPGIQKDHLPFLFRRFWRAPDARHDGAGLGLAICKEIASVHDWRLTVNSLSIGTRFTVWL
ncbi:two-component sensor histidine kinase [Burkholderia sp. WAC0059]|uniref:sensor histidine kinase n=1 Tax=Burkholderia sp. WAC0059 TaxID=2066022 RepID=UPI000C7E9354|nr:HAMP domain-containing sensor histidine kinase [Burkholderia sp. WAC0059]PLZ00587.1 two-component sensor histidine kinase [Burkholderia sp. WAC0059]